MVEHHVKLQYCRENFDSLMLHFNQVIEDGRTLSAYIYSINNPGSLPESIKAAMRSFEYAKLIKVN